MTVSLNPDDNGSVCLIKTFLTRETLSRLSPRTSTDGALLKLKAKLKNKIRLSKLLQGGLFLQVLDLFLELLERRVEAGKLSGQALRRHLEEQTTGFR